MKVFILEDDNERIRLFREHGIKHDLTIAMNYKRGTELYNPPYDLVLLDHDLAPEHYAVLDIDQGLMPECEETGHTFCQWLVHNHSPDDIRRGVIIHSYNPIGAVRMGNTLKDAGFRVYIQPFGPTVLKNLEAD